MRNRLPLLTACILLAAAIANTIASASSAHAAQDTGVAALDGEWIFVEDRTEGRPVEQHQPSMSNRVRLRVEDNAVTLIRSDAEIRMPIDGTPTDITMEGRVSRYSGQWKDGAFIYQSEPVREPGDTRPVTLIRWELRPTDEGLLARASVNPPDGFTSLALYRHPQDIDLPTPAQATIDDIAWLSGAWTGTRGSENQISIEERWSPPLGGSMLATSRTVSRGSLRAFEYLRILRRDTGLVYIAQPNGGTPTEFVLTELTDTRAVFENPRHDFPQRITYNLAPEGQLTATIGYINGGTPRTFEFTREGR
ncbi:MAG: DUF6265 family protein [Phycisphaerales bacterium]|nr:hypothetical protein [Phycisphaerales bacterium]